MAGGGYRTEGPGTKRVLGNGDCSGGGEGSAAGVIFERSLRLTKVVGSLGGVSSFWAYPAHFRPKFAHRRQSGLVSSHFTRRALFVH